MTTRSFKITPLRDQAKAALAMFLEAAQHDGASGLIEGLISNSRCPGHASSSLIGESFTIFGYITHHL